MDGDEDASASATPLPCLCLIYAMSCSIQLALWFLVGWPCGAEPDGRSVCAFCVDLTSKAACLGLAATNALAG